MTTTVSRRATGRVNVPETQTSPDDILAQPVRPTNINSYIITKIHVNHVNSYSDPNLWSRRYGGWKS